MQSYVSKKTMIQKILIHLEILKILISKNQLNAYLKVLINRKV
jgi:hypothetical protein